MRGPKFCLVVMVLAASGLSGCTSAEPAGQTVTATATVTVTSEVSAALPPSPPSEASSVRFFRTPTQNISCLIEPAQDMFAQRIECAIGESTFAEQSPDTDCQQDWLPNFVNLYPTGFVDIGECRGGVAPVSVEGFSNNTVLDYGKATAVDGLVRKSEKTGVTCWSERSKHGFVLSRERLLTF